jgi:hypothetical protein
MNDNISSLKLNIILPTQYSKELKILLPDQLSNKLILNQT